MEKKKLIPSFGCRNGRAIIMDEGREYYSDDILTLASYYSDYGADGLLICDLSEGDEDHEKTIDTIRQVAREIDIPVIAGGRVKRLEDVKKYLYAGAKATFLNVSEPENVDLIREACNRFGSEKIYVYMPGIQYLRHHIEEYAQLGASMAILDVMMDDSEIASMPASPIPILAVCDEDVAGTIAAYLKVPSVAGVVLTVAEKLEGDCMRWKQELKKRGIPVETFESSVSWEDFKLNADGLIPVIVQDYRSSQVLMLAYMNREAFHQTLETGRMTYFSRSRQALWVKGETSGHFQFVKSLKLDCDHDTILAKVRQIGPACHTGEQSCFFTTLAEKEYRDVNPLRVFENVFDVICDRKEHPKEGSYTNYLFDKGLDKILKKLGEEATEIVIASKNPNPEEIKYEISDFLYHMMVLMAAKGITWEEITRELANRE